MSDVVVEVNGSTVVVEPALTEVEILQQGTAIEIAPNNHDVVIDATPAPVVEVAATGLRGPPGPPGQPGGTVPPIPFGYGDAPGTIWTAPAAGTLAVARLKMTVPFDDAAASLSLGTAEDHEAVLPADLNAPSLIAEYEYTPDLRLAADQPIWIYPSPGTSVAGAGIVFLTFLPD